MKISSVLKAPLWPFRKIGLIKSARRDRKSAKEAAKDAVRFSRMSDRLQAEVNRTRSRLNG